MHFHEVIQGLAGAPHLAAYRPPSDGRPLPKPVLVMNRAGRVLDLSGPRPRTYCGVFADYIAIDWMLIKLDDLAKRMQEVTEQMQPPAPELGPGRGK